MPSGDRHGVRLGRLVGLPVPTTAREAFELVGRAGHIDDTTVVSLLAMVGFRNIAIHECGRLDLSIARAIIEHRLDDLLAFSKAMLRADPTP